MKPRIVENAESALTKVAHKQVKLIKARVITLIKRLNKTGVVKVTGMLSGMGCYTFQGNNFVKVYSDRSEGEGEISWFFEWAEVDSRKIYKPKYATQQTLRDAQEILACMDFIIDCEYSHYFDIREDELV